MSICKSCDLMYIVVNYITPLMQFLTNDIRSFNMQLKTTKCLNTALMITFLFLGKKGIKHAEVCDSNAIVSRYEKGEHNNHEMIEKIKKLVMRPTKKRYMFYILLNEGYFGDKYFPGHVFIIEKSNTYNLYQSYINKYDLKSYYETQNNTFQMSRDEVKNLIKKLEYIVLTSKTWDEKCVKYWKEFTHVDTSNIKDAPHVGKLNICMSHAPITSCLWNIEKYIKKKKKEIKDLDPSSIYGSLEYYDTRSIQPLTVGELSNKLNNILEDIHKNKIHV